MFTNKKIKNKKKAVLILKIKFRRIKMIINKADWESKDQKLIPKLRPLEYEKTIDGMREKEKSRTNIKTIPLRFEFNMYLMIDKLN